MELLKSILRTFLIHWCLSFFSSKKLQKWLYFPSRGVFNICSNLPTLQLYAWINRDLLLQKQNQDSILKSLCSSIFNAKC